MGRGRGVGAIVWILVWLRRTTGLLDEGCVQGRREGLIILGVVHIIFSSAGNEKNPRCRWARIRLQRQKMRGPQRSERIAAETLRKATQTLQNSSPSTIPRGNKNILTPPSAYSLPTHCLLRSAAAAAAFTTRKQQCKMPPYVFTVRRDKYPPLV